MKILSSIFSIIILCFNIYCSQTKNNEKQIIQMLSNFYTAYNKAWSSNLDSESLIKELKVLQEKNCTEKLRNKLNTLFKNHGLDHDIMINDIYTDMQLIKTMSINKDPKTENGYVVTYNAKTEDPYNKEKIVEVNIHITVLKENDHYLIDSVQ